MGRRVCERLEVRLGERPAREKRRKRGKEGSGLPVTLRAIAGLLLLALAAPAAAGEADVLDARAECDAARICRFVVTVRHADEGWGHYADAWLVLAPDGAVLAKRVLRHPHVGEQPFTRDLAGVAVPEGLERVRIRAHDSVHGEGGAEVTVDISR